MRGRFPKALTLIKIPLTGTLIGGGGQLENLKTQLEKRSFNITKRFLRIIEIFQDAKFEQQLRIEIEKVKPALLPALA